MLQIVKSLTLALPLAVLCLLRPALAEERCGVMTILGIGCRVYVADYRLKMKVRKQQSSVTRWAASLSNLLTYYHVRLTEMQITQEITGTPRIASPDVLNDAVNHTYDLPSGDSVTLSAKVTDNYWKTARDLENTDIYESLKDNTPIFYGDLNHAMVLVSGDFVQGPAGMTPVSGIVADPNPAKSNFRPLEMWEMIGMYAAVVSVDGS